MKKNLKLKTQNSKLIIAIKNCIKKANNIFISFTLFLFYFLIIGVGALVYKFSRKRNKKNNSYWQEFPKNNLSFDYFKSPY